MTAPSATSASNFPVFAIFCRASGASSAPGTVTILISASRTPSLASASVQLVSRPSPTSALNRASTMPMRRPLPFAPASISSMESYLAIRELDRETAVRSERCVRAEAIGCGSLRGSRRLRLQVTRNLQVESRHARHSTRLREQPHFFDAELAQNLRADAVGAQRIFLRHGDGAGLCALEKVVRRFRP